MKIIKKILYFILVMLVLAVGFVVVCAFRPGAAEAVAEFLYPERERTVVTEISNMPETDTPIYTGQGEEEVSDGILESTETVAAVKEGEDHQGLGEDVTSEYIPPSQDEIVIPENVSGRNGYRQIQDEQEQIDDRAAQELQSRLDAGYTGDGLEFDAVYYPYYAMLDEKGKHVYRQIYANAGELHPAFSPVEPVTAGELKNIFSAVVNDHPELFWMETAYAGKFVRNGQCVEIDLSFNRTAQNLESAKAYFAESADQIIAEAQNLPGNYEREKFVHDALLERVSYNLGAEMNQSAYSALVNGQTVCAGYARAFQYILQQLGIPCYYCTGYAGESHAWNIVALDDGCYNVDTTWDDTGDGTYDYFNRTDEDYAGNHIRQELSVYLPPCNGQAYRDLEQGTEESGLRSLADVGLTEEQVITDMQGYYGDCYAQIMRNGAGRYTFYNVIEGDALLSEWYRNYQNEHYRQAYMERAMTEIGASSCEIVIETERLQGGRYLITHEVSVR